MYYPYSSNTTIPTPAPFCRHQLLLLLLLKLQSLRLLRCAGTNFFQERSPQYFGDFMTALFTMFQVLTGDSWASDVAREVFKDSEGDQTDHSVGINM